MSFLKHEIKYKKKIIKNVNKTKILLIKLLYPDQHHPY